MDSSKRIITLLICLLIILPALHDPAFARGPKFRPAATRAIAKAISTNTRQIFKPSFTIRSRYAGAMNSVSISRDGQWFVTAGDSGMAHLWDMTTGRQESVLSRGTSPIKGVAFVPGQDRLITVDGHGKLLLRDISTDTIIREINTSQPGNPTLLAVTPFAAKGLKTRGLKFTGGAGSAPEFSYEGQYCLAPDSKTQIGVWDLDTGKKIRAFDGHSANLTALTVAESGFLAASGDDSGKVILWNWQTGAMVGEFQYRKVVTALALGNDGALMAAGLANGEIHSWQVGTKKELLSITGHVGAVRSVSFSPNITEIASAGDDNIIKTWSAAQGNLLKEMPGHTGAINDLKYSPSSKELLSCSADKTSRFWDTASGEEMARLVSMKQGWAVVSPAGYFDGTLDGELEDRLDAILWTVGKRAFKVDGFIEGYYRPALLGRLFAGQDPASGDLPSISDGFELPPQVRIISPSPDSSFQKRQITVEVEAIDEGGGIDSISLFHNQKIVPGGMVGRSNNGNNSTKTFTVALEDDENHFRAVGFGKNRIESEGAEIVVNYSGAKPLEPPVLHLFVVGINTYLNPALNLNFGVPDARAVSGYFGRAKSGFFADISTHHLFDSQASREGVSKMLADMEGIPARDTIVLYFAGHGETVGDEWFYIPYDMGALKDEQGIRAKGISSKILQEHLGNSQAQRIVLLLDACKSGAAMQAFAAFEDQRPFSLLSRATGIHIAAASTSQQYASELEELGHGVFTFTLLNALDGQADLQPSDGRISVQEVLAYINEQMPLLIKKHNTSAQRPITSSRGIDFAISLNP
ncbi:MAG: caspase family protein [Proteobacteria bacterium]|nr:caspase family protein [Pseudomonadota bacterium]MBU1739604.1 caspase family protein [Pseudomonadota bacterium]